jgi:hypothetical protein
MMTGSTFHAGLSRKALLTSKAFKVTPSLPMMLLNCSNGETELQSGRPLFSALLYQSLSAA